MIGPNDGGGDAEVVGGPLSVRIDDLAGKWTDLSVDHPLCASCSKKIDGEDDDGMEIIPVRLWKKEHGETFELALCPACFGQRIATSPAK